MVDKLLDSYLSVFGTVADNQDAVVQAFRGAIRLVVDTARVETEGCLGGINRHGHGAHLYRNKNLGRNCDRRVKIGEYDLTWTQTRTCFL